jgi:glucose-6-phosphate 1-epimerase
MSLPDDFSELAGLKPSLPARVPVPVPVPVPAPAPAAAPAAAAAASGLLAMAQPPRAQRFAPAQSDLLHLRAADGASALLSRHGPELLCWRTAAGEEQLHCGQHTAPYGPVDRLGPANHVAFPQVGMLGPLPNDGLSSTRLWQMLTTEQDAQGHAVARLRLEADTRTRAIWDHDFACEYKLRVGGNLLQIDLLVHNRGQRAWSFQAALSTHLWVNDLRCAGLLGLHSAPFLNRNPGGSPAAPFEDDVSLVRVADVHRFYPQAPSRLLLRDGDRSVAITSHGFADKGFLNRSPNQLNITQKLGSYGERNIQPQAWRNGLCVTTANVSTPEILRPGARWAGMQRVRVIVGR